MEIRTKEGKKKLEIEFPKDGKNWHLTLIIECAKPLTSIPVLILGILHSHAIPNESKTDYEKQATITEWLIEEKWFILLERIVSIADYDISPTPFSLEMASMSYEDLESSISAIEITCQLKKTND